MFRPDLISSPRSDDSERLPTGYPSRRPDTFPFCDATTSGTWPTAARRTADRTARSHAFHVGAQDHGACEVRSRLAELVLHRGSCGHVSGDLEGLAVVG